MASLCNGNGPYFHSGYFDAEVLFEQFLIHNAV